MCPHSQLQVRPGRSSSRGQDVLRDLHGTRCAWNLPLLCACTTLDGMPPVSNFRTSPASIMRPRAVVRGDASSSSTSPKPGGALARRAAARARPSRRSARRALAQPDLHGRPRAPPRARRRRARRLRLGGDASSPSADRLPRTAPAQRRAKPVAARRARSRAAERSRRGTRTFVGRSDRGRRASSTPQRDRSAFKGQGRRGRLLVVLLAHQRARSV